MTMSLADARQKLAKVGIELGNGFRRSAESTAQTVFVVTTPVGTQLQLNSRELAGILRDLNKLSIPG